MKNNNKLIIVVPVYNEEEIIQIVIDNIFKKLNEFDFNILIINDGSTDRSLQKIKDIKKKYGKKINYIDQKNIGHGPSVIKGYKYAIENNFDYILQIDSDNQFDILDFKKLWACKEKFDLVIGFRKNRKDVFLRRLLTRIVKFIIFVLFFVKVKDSNCPFRLIKKDLLVKIMNFMHSDLLIPNIFISIYAAKKKTIFFVEVLHMNRMTGVVSIVNLKLFLFCVKALKQILTFRFKI